MPLFRALALRFGTLFDAAVVWTLLLAARRTRTRSRPRSEMRKKGLHEMRLSRSSAI